MVSHQRGWVVGWVAVVVALGGGCTQSSGPSSSSPKPVSSQHGSADDSHWTASDNLTPDQELDRRTREYLKNLEMVQNGSNADGSAGSGVEPVGPAVGGFDPNAVKFSSVPHRQDPDLADTNITVVRTPRKPTPVPVLDRDTPALNSPTEMAVQAQAEKAGDLQSPAANKPAPVRKPVSDLPLIVPENADGVPTDSASRDDLHARLLRRSRENPKDVAAQLDLQLYAMLNDDPQPELSSITLLPHKDAEIVNALIDGLSEFRSTVREDETMLLSKKLRALRNMSTRLEAMSSLSLPVVVLCRKADGFGKYEPIAPKFEAERDNKVIVYCEVENFESKQNDNQMWETELTQQITLYSDTSQQVTHDEPHRVPDFSRERRHDFYTLQMVKLPKELSIGRYMMKVTITDENAGKVAENNVNFEIVAPAMSNQ